MGCHCEPPTLAAHARGALPLVRAAWGVTARKASQNASNARGVAVGMMGRNSSVFNEGRRGGRLEEEDKRQRMVEKTIR